MSFKVGEFQYAAVAKLQREWEISGIEEVAVGPVALRQIRMVARVCPAIASWLRWTVRRPVSITCMPYGTTGRMSVAATPHISFVSSLS